MPSGDLPNAPDHPATPAPFGPVYTVYKERGIDMRQAAYVLALGRVVEAIDPRGF